MVSRLRLCRAIQAARASASATVVIASTNTASFSPKIKVDVMGSKPSASPKGLGRSPTMAFPGAVKTFTFRLLDATGVVTRGASFGPFVPLTLEFPFDLGANRCLPSPGECAPVDGCARPCASERALYTEGLGATRQRLEGAL